MYSAEQLCIVMLDCVSCIYFYAVMLSVYLFILFLIALFIFLLGAVLAQLLQTQQIPPKHFGHEVADSIDLRI